MSDKDKKLKIAIGMKLQEGSFGGGNQFGKALSKFLVSKNIDVVFNLKDKDIDLILLTETRKWLKSCAFDLSDVLKYFSQKPDTLIVFRVNECDERKGSKIKLLNRLIIETVKISHRTVFISSWLKNIFVSNNSLLNKKSLVIYNGADNIIFNSRGYEEWDHKEPLKIVTHHWGANWFKGFDIYLFLDSLIGKKYKNKIQFSFIGNLPKKVIFENTKVISPKSGEVLAREIKKNHIYLTASINEPAGMHHVEGALCGLPLLYRNSGALPEYCNEYGIIFNGKEDFQISLEKIIEKYDYFAEKIKKYNNNSEKMAKGYYDLFMSLIYDKENIIKKRKFNNFHLFFYSVFFNVLKVILRLKEKLLKLFF